MKLKKGLAPAAGIMLYVGLFTLFIMSANKFMYGPDPVWAPLVFLMLFCFSVLTCGLIVFYRPYLLFIDKKPKEAGELVLATAKWLGVLVLIVIVAVAVASR